MLSKLRRTYGFLALLGVCGCVLSTSQVWGQSPRNTFLPAPRALRQHLNRARTALDEERFGDAISELVPILSKSADFGQESADYFLAAPDANRATTSLKSEALRLIGAMPREGLELYELQYGSDARALLDDAIRTGDVGKLSEVVRRFFHTRAGYKAMMLSARLHLDRNQPVAAALCFQRIVDSSVGSTMFDPEASILLAASWYYADRLERAVETLAPLKQRFPNARLQIGLNQAPRLPDRDTALAWLARHFDQRPLFATGPSQWLLHRGTADRNTPVEGGLPLSTLRWRTPIAEFEADETLIQEIQTGSISQGFVGVSSLSPLAVNDVILMRSPDRMLAIDFVSGKRIWEYPWGNQSFPPVTTTRRGGTHNQEIAERKDQLYERLWLDAPYGQVSSDGEAVFLLDDLRFTRRRPRPFRRQMPRRRGGVAWQQYHNQLVALDLKRQGSLRWMVGGETGLDEPKLAGAFFLGAPLPLAGQLFVLAELNAEIRLIALNGQTGKQEWSQPLAHVDSISLMNNQRRLAGASPSYADGILICPTSAGAIVGIELASRSLLWGYQYEMFKPRKGYNSFNMSVKSPRPTPRGWIDATVAIADGIVVLTPPESQRLYCLDLLSGNALSAPKDPDVEIGGAAYVACIDEGNAILVGSKGIAAVRLSNNEPAWDQEIEFDEERDEAPSGRGFQSGDFYFLPTTISRLIKIDLRKGQIVHETKTDQVLGNLICYKDEVISQGSDYLATFYQVTPLQARVERRLRSDPDDAWALARRGELLINDGQLRPALDSLRRAHELEPGKVGIRALLVKTLLSALQKDFAEYQDSALELERLIDRPAQRLEYLRLMAAGLHSVEQFGDAATKYFALADMVIEELGGKDLESIAAVSYDEHGTARLDRWINSRLSTLYDAADQEVQQYIADQIEERFESLVGLPAAAIRRQLAFFGFHASAADARAELAVRTAEAENWLEAELLISEISEQAGPAAAIAVTGDVVRLLNDVGKYQPAAAFYRLLVHHWPEPGAASETTGRRQAESIAIDDSLRRRLESGAWPYGKVNVSKDRSGSIQNRDGISVPVRRSKAAPGMVAYSVQFQPRQFTVRNGYGRVVSKADLVDVSTHRAYGLNYAERHGHLLVAVLSDHIIALDVLARPNRNDEAVLWSDRFALPLSNLGINDTEGKEPRENPFDLQNPTNTFVKDAGGKPVGDLGPVNTDGVVYLKSRTLVCVDPLTGHELWSRGNIERGTDVFGDREYVFLVPPKSDEATVLSAVDGSPLGSRKIPRDHWITNGRLILAYEARGDQWRLHLYDAWLEKDVWSEMLARDTRGTLATNAVAFMEPGGRFAMRSLTDNSVLVDASIDPEQSLKAIYVFVNSDQYLLVTDRTDGTRRQESSPFRRVSGMPAPMIRGRVHAFSREDGRPLWQTPAAIEDYALPLHQPTELPTLWFVRQSSSGRPRSPQTKFSALCLDRRDGRILLDEDVVTQRVSNGYQFTASEDSKVATLVLQRFTINVEFTDEPAPPSPPAQVTSNLAAEQE